MSLNARWHSCLPRLGRGIIKIPYLSYGAIHRGEIRVIAIWSNPVARLLPQKEWLELRRLALGPHTPRNTASWMLGVMARMIRRSMPRINTLVSYHDTSVHSGAIYRAAGWTMDAITCGKDWRNAKERSASEALRVAANQGERSAPESRPARRG